MVWGSKNDKGFGDLVMTNGLGIQEWQRFWGSKNDKGFGDPRMPKVLGIQEWQRFMGVQEWQNLNLLLSFLKKVWPNFVRLWWPDERRPGSSSVSALSAALGLSFDSIFLSALLFFCLVLLLLPVGMSGLSLDSIFLSALLFFCLVLLLILPSTLFLLLTQSPVYFTEMSFPELVFLEIGFFVLPLFLVVLLAARRW